MAVQTNTFKGARYVPKFADPIEWSADNSYEAIESVQHNGFTYLSKQPVPAGVQIDNEAFWLEWADPNAQMQALKNEVDQYVDNVEELSGVVGQWGDELATEIQNRENADNAINSTRVILIGDSYGQGYTPDGNVTGWVEIVKNWFAKINGKATVKAVGGYGFGGGGFLTLIQDAISDLTELEKQEVKTVIFGGGYNDRNFTQAQISSGISNCCSAIRANLPNAKVLLAPFGMCVEGKTNGVHADATYSQMVLIYRRWQIEGATNGCGLIPHCNSLLRHDKYFSSDYVHPNQDGQFVLAFAVMNAINGGSYDVRANDIAWTRYPFTIGSTDYQANVAVRNDAIHFEMPAITYNFPEPISYVCDGNTAIKISDPLNIAPLQPYGEIHVICSALWRYKEEAGQAYKYVVMPTTITINSTGIHTRMALANDNQTNFKTLPLLDRIQFSTQRAPFVYDALLQVN